MGRRFRLVAMVIATLALGAPTAAVAARVTSANGELTYIAGPGEHNSLAVTASPAGVTFEDKTAGVSARGAVHT